jgi:hypothetical protein
MSSEVKRYMPHDMAHDPLTHRSVFQAIEHPQGLYVLASDFDSVVADLRRPREALETVRVEYIRGFWNDNTLLCIDAALAGKETTTVDREGEPQ